MELTIDDILWDSVASITDADKDDIWGPICTPLFARSYYGFDPDPATNAQYVYTYKTKDLNIIGNYILENFVNAFNDIIKDADGSLALENNKLKVDYASCKLKRSGDRISATAKVDIYINNTDYDAANQVAEDIHELMLDSNIDFDSIEINPEESIQKPDTYNAINVEFTKKFSLNELIQQYQDVLPEYEEEEDEN